MTKYEATTVLVTGGTGSFGNALVDHLLFRGCPAIRVLSRDEAKQDAMRRRLAGCGNVRFYLGDVRDRASIDSAMTGVDLVFHAAALKQVPSCEFFPLEAVATNVLGSANVVDAAISSQVSRVVLLGTDKAVAPINAMGMTKGLMEKVGQAAARNLLLEAGSTTVCITRYGNVLYSRGSVIPLFVEQLKRGEPLTITEPSMTRFLLPLSGAIDLVEFAWTHGKNGDVFVRKAPACTVADLAVAVQNVFGRQVGTTRIGMRHGEKVFETLAGRNELVRADEYPEYYQIPIDDRDLNYALYYDEGEPREASLDEYNSHNTTRVGVEDVEQILRSLPEIQEELGSW
jgi:UDP-N-acetylglucosamine 4,6-dehydratase/5-epimerase